jgi:hypothetical protein
MAQTTPVPAHAMHFKKLRRGKLLDMIAPFYLTIIFPVIFGCSAQ